MNRVGPLDAIFLLLERMETPMHVGCLLCFDRPASPGFLTKLLADLRQSEVSREPFCHLLTPPHPKLAWPHWVADDGFDASYHIRHLALPAPGNMRQLEELVGNLHSTMLDRHRPLWEAYLIEGLEGNRFAFYMKTHHACIDGMGGMRAIQDMLATSRRDRALRAPWAESEAPETSPVQDWRAAMRDALDLQVQTLPQVGHALRELLHEVVNPRKRRSLLPYQAPDCLLNRPLSANRRFATATIPLSEVRVLCEQTGASVNDVALAVCSGALRSYLKGKRALPRQPLIAFVPVALKESGGLPGHNQICNLQCDLGTHIAKPQGRLRRIRSSIETGKQLLAGMSGAAMQNYALILGAPFLLSEVLRLTPYMPPPFNVVISNVPGPSEARYLRGAELESMYPVSVLADNQALNITFFSYRGRLQFGLLACWRVLPDLDVFAECLQASWAELQATLQ